MEIREGVFQVHNRGEDAGNALHPVGEAGERRTAAARPGVSVVFGHMVRNVRIAAAVDIASVHKGHLDNKMARDGRRRTGREERGRGKDRGRGK